MMANGKYAQASQSIFMSSMTGLANVLALVSAFVGTPWLHSNTIGWVMNFIVSNYGYGFEGLTNVVWFLICAAFVFFVSRATVSTAIVMVAITIATRFI